MNTLSALDPSLGILRPSTQNYVALLVTSLLTSCGTLPQQQQREEIRKPEILGSSVLTPEKTLEQYKQELTADITEKIQNDPEFHSLRKIKNYLEEVLGKEGLIGIASVQITPFIPDEKGQFTYLMISIITPRGLIEIKLTTGEKELALPALMSMLDTFEQELQICVLTTSLEEIERTGGILDRDSLEEKIDQALQKMSHIFLQHGLKYEGMKLKVNNGLLEGEMEFFDIYNGESKCVPLPTGIEIEEEPKRRGNRDGQTMMA